MNIRTKDISEANMDDERVVARHWHWLARFQPYTDIFINYIFKYVYPVVFIRPPHIFARDGVGICIVERLSLVLPGYVQSDDVS